MSTKIYNGFRIEATDMGEILAIVRAFRPWVERKQLEVYEEWCAARNAARKESLPRDHQDYDKDCLFSWMAARREIKNTGIRCPDADTDFEAIFLPFESAMYGITFVEHRTWHLEWLEQPGVCEYSYWDNTDKPDYVTDEEWDARGEIWDRILPGAAVPAMHGFTIAIGNPNGPNLF